MSATILVLEDDLVLQDLLCEVLQDEGYTVVAVPTLADLVAHMPPAVDLVLSDMLVDLDAIGIAAIHAVRRATRRFVPAILCTGAANQVETHRDEIERLGAVVIHKPFAIDDLLDAVKAALRVPARALDAVAS